MRYLALALLLFTSPALALDYDMVYLRAPRHGDGTGTEDRPGAFPDVNRPWFSEPGTDLVLLKPDGTQTVLAEGGATGAIMDPCPSLDGKSVYYSWIADVRPSPLVAVGATTGADIWKLDLATGQHVKLTSQVFTPNEGVHRFGSLDHGVVYNTGACPIPGGRIVFTSTRNGVRLGGTSLAFQLFVMDENGKNVEQIGHLNLGSALHPVLLKDGRIMWSSHENQGHRSGVLWSLWASYPDGRKWEPLVFSSSWNSGGSWHFQGQRSDGVVFVTEYYFTNNSGFGEILGFPVEPPVGVSAFGFPESAKNPAVSPKFAHSYPFQRYGLFAATPWADHVDQPSPGGKVSHPTAAPGNKILLTKSKGPAHVSAKPFLDAGIYLLAGDKAATPENLIEVVNSPDYNEFMAKALVPWEQIYGGQPPAIPDCPGDTGHPLLPPGSPFGLVGTSTFYAVESWGANFGVGGNSNFVIQGSNATEDGGKFDLALIDRVRILAEEPTTFTRGSGLKDFSAGDTEERLRVLGEIPLRKFDTLDAPILDRAGNPDTSFLARIPADTPFTFQLLAADGTALNTAQTWHQLRPGERRDDCRGCHGHNAPGIVFEGTVASGPDYQIADLTKLTPWTREYFRDVLPVFMRACLPCHTGSTPAAGLALDESYVGDTKGSKSYAARISTIYKRMKEGHGNAPTAEETLTVAQWIDLGCQKSTEFGADRNNALNNDHKPTLFVDGPRRQHAGALTKIRFGAADYAGLDSTKTSVKASFAVNGHLPGEDLAGDFPPPVDSVWTLPLSPAFTGSGELTVVIWNTGGNSQRVVRSFVTAATPPPCDQELAALREEVRRLNEFAAMLGVENAALKAERDALKAKIAAVKVIVE